MMYEAAPGAYFNFGDGGMNESAISLDFGLQSDLFWDPLNETAFEAAYKNGFRFFEIWGHVPWFDIYSASMANEVKKMASDCGMWIRSVHSPCEGGSDISSESTSTRRKSVSEVVLSIENCRKMGGTIVVVHPGGSLNSTDKTAQYEHDRRISNSIRSFEEIERIAADNGVRIAVENLCANDVGGSEKHFLRLLEALNPRIFGICFDSSHANINPGTFEMFRRVSHPIITTHLSDNHGAYDEHKPPFTASVDWNATIELILRNGYHGPWLLEVTNGGADPLEVLAVMRNSAEKLKELICRKEKNI